MALALLLISIIFIHFNYGYRSILGLGVDHLAENSSLQDPPNDFEDQSAEDIHSNDNEEKVHDSPEYEHSKEVPTREKYAALKELVKQSSDKAFIPMQSYAQVRASHTVSRVPRSRAPRTEEAEESDEDAARLREVVTHSKVATVYTEEGYEDSAYDHGGRIRNGEFHEDKAKKSHGEFDYDSHGKSTGTAIEKASPTRSKSKQSGYHSGDRRDHLDESTALVESQIREHRQPPESDKNCEATENAEDSCGGELYGMKIQPKLLIERGTGQMGSGIKYDDAYSVVPKWRDELTTVSRDEPNETTPITNDNGSRKVSDVYHSDTRKTGFSTLSESVPENLLSQQMRNHFDISPSAGHRGGMSNSDSDGFDQPELKRSTNSERSPSNQASMKSKKMMLYSRKQKKFQPIENIVKNSSTRDSILSRTLLPPLFKRSDEQNLRTKIKEDGSENKEKHINPEGEESVHEVDKDTGIKIPRSEFEEESNDEKTEEPKVVVDSGRYPFHGNFAIPSYLTLKYVVNPERVPQKIPGGMDFYDSRSYQECESIEDVGSEEDVPKLGKLGEKLECYKAKYFDRNPLDNPLFSKTRVEQPRIPAGIYRREFIPRIQSLPLKTYYSVPRQIHLNPRVARSGTRITQLVKDPYRYEQPNVLRENSRFLRRN